MNYNQHVSYAFNCLYVWLYPQLSSTTKIIILEMVGIQIKMATAPGEIIAIQKSRCNNNYVPLCLSVSLKKIKKCLFLSRIVVSKKNCHVIVLSLHFLPVPHYHSTRGQPLKIRFAFGNVNKSYF